MKPIAVTVREFCELVGIQRTKAYALIRDGEASTCHISRRTVVRLDSIEALIERSSSDRIAR